MFFPRFIVEAVEAISRRPKEKDEFYFLRIKENDIATKVKLKDLLDNMRFVRMNKCYPDDGDVERLIKYAYQVKELMHVINSKL